MIALAGNIFWGPMAITIIGGPVVATLLTLLVVPAPYALWFRVHDHEGAPAMPANGESEASRGGFAPVGVAAV
jgi:multidrug efflux pump